MSQMHGLNRRSFLRNAGLTALAGAAAGSSNPLMAAAAGSAFQVPANGKYDFDTTYNRFGSHSTKFDQQIRVYGKGSVDVGMGIADIDFKAAPCITDALSARMKHENWGYLDMGEATPMMTEAIAAWNKKHYGIDIDPNTMVLSAGVHPGLIAALITFSPKGSRVLLQTPTYNGFYSDLTFSQTKAEDVPLKFVGGKFAMDFEEFEKRIAHDTHTFILC
ncbi:MAG: aminotransferase class I/II-fold pyridoxal phosphate-dependent enzyme, partial [Acidobacteria bacterium]|nr:aminotransferase class I/II-fold pyridoxal phosphate-dependent enzyme [Acidobacteriota bacterium]